jgi:hypothetical protein
MAPVEVVSSSCKADLYSLFQLLNKDDLSKISHENCHSFPLRLSWDSDAEYELTDGGLNRNYTEIIPQLHRNYTEIKRRQSPNEVRNEWNQKAGNVNFNRNNAGFL